MKFEKPTPAIILFVFLALACAGLIVWLLPRQPWISTIAALVLGLILGRILRHKGNKRT